MRKRLTRYKDGRLQRSGSRLLAGMSLVGAILLSGCSKDVPGVPDDGEPVAVRFTASVDGMALPAYLSANSQIHSGTPETRTTNDGNDWVAGDKVGLHMVSSGGTVPEDILSVRGIRAYNLPYTISDAATGAMTPDGNDPLYYPQSGPVDFIAYYPYLEDVDAVWGVKETGYSINLWNYQKTEQDMIDLDVLYARATNVSRSTSPVELSFRHVLSKISFNITIQDSKTPLVPGDVTAVSITEIPVTTILDWKGNTTYQGIWYGELQTIKLSTANNGYDATFTSLMVPHPGSAYTGRTVVFTVDGQEYSWPMPDTDDFVEGVHYTYPVTVKWYGIEVGEASISTWTVNNNADGSGNAAEIGRGIEKVFIPAGTFQMGSPETETGHNDSEPLHEVTLTRDFYMSKYPITNSQYAAFLNSEGVGSDGQYNTAEYGDQSLIGTHQRGVTYDTDKWIPQPGYENHPVVSVTWYGAYEYALWVGGRLPTEAQWEYACRAGTTTAYSYGDTADGDYMWYSENTAPTYSTQPVGQKLPNPWGLYDMHGNVYEWCYDFYHQNYGSWYPHEPATDPTGPASGINRVLRGGAANTFAKGCRAANRMTGSPTQKISNYGFRVVF